MIKQKLEVGANKMFGNSLILDRGSADGVEIDFPVVVDEGIIIGKIFKVWGSVIVIINFIPIFLLPIRVVINFNLINLFIKNDGRLNRKI